jgi:acetylglutamate kinase
VAAGGMQAKLTAAIDAVEHGVLEVRIIKGSDPFIVQSMFDGDFRNEEPGTRIIARHEDPLLPLMTAIMP